MCDEENPPIDLAGMSVPGPAAGYPARTASLTSLNVPHASARESYADVRAVGRGFGYSHFSETSCGDWRIKPLRGPIQLGRAPGGPSTGLNSGHLNWVRSPSPRRVRIENLQLIGAKVSNLEFRGIRRNSLDISKGLSQRGMLEFDPWKVSQPVPESEKIAGIMTERPPMAGFCNPVDSLHAPDLAD